MAVDPASSDRSTRERPPWAPLVTAAVVVPTVLAGLTLLWPRAPIEAELTRDANAALSTAGISGAVVRFDGRDATISGVTGTAADQAVRTVEGVTGVRVAQVLPGGGPGPAPAPATAAATTTAPEPSTSAAPTPSATPAPSATAVPAPGGGELDAAAKQALQAKLTDLLRANPITFDPDRPRLTDQGRSTLTAVLAAVRSAPAARLRLDGFVATGPGNGELTAAQLSEQRAAAVRDAMVAGGVPADRLTARGRGEDTTSRERALGRRVDITVV